MDFRDLSTIKLNPLFDRPNINDFCTFELFSFDKGYLIIESSPSCLLIRNGSQINSSTLLNKKDHSFGTWNVVWLFFIFLIHWDTFDVSIMNDDMRIHYIDIQIFHNSKKKVNWCPKNKVYLINLICSFKPKLMKYHVISTCPIDLWV